MTDAPLLEMRGISKRFPGVKALDQVDFSVYSGEVHALVGENGAGKSTLMKILAGAYQADEGNILLDGEPIDIRSPSDGIKAGLNVVYQELVLAPHLTVAENILLGQEPRLAPLILDWSGMRRRAREVLAQLGVELDVRRTVRSLSVAEQQIVEIARALQRQSRLLVLDEPSAVLGKRDIELLYTVIRRLKEQNIAVVYISHRLEEIFLIADRVTVLKNGEVVGTAPANSLDEDSLVNMMIGRKLETMYLKDEHPAGRELLRVEGLTDEGKYENVSFSLRAGEILGVAGLIGSGRTALAMTLTGATQPTSGSIHVNGSKVRFRSPSDALSRGIGLLPEDRNSQGLFLKRPVVENISIANLDRYRRGPALDLSAERKDVRRLMADIGVQATSEHQIVANLSGGNKQKVVLARWLGANSKILIFDEPTRGVDVGAKVEIYRIMDQLASQGAAILMISSEMPEILGMSDNILVMWRGKVAGYFSRAEGTEEKVLQAALIGANKNGQD